MRRVILLSACLSCAPAAAPASVVTTAGGDGEQQIAELGTCALESGEKIEHCRIGYRTVGKLDATRSNVVLFPTWFTGTTKPLVEYFAGTMIDTKRFFVVFVDAIGDGVSSSPSNSTEQPHLRFPRFTIHDMVESQRRLLREKLGVDHLRAVVGISMGGMQTFEWSVAHPDDLDRAVAIVGTPQLTSEDLLLWNAELHTLDDSSTYAHGEYQGRPKIPAVMDIHRLMLTTPHHRVMETSRAEYPTWSREIESDVAFDWNDWHRQLEAMLGHDVARAHGGSLETAARTVKARMLVVVNVHDHMVNPEPATSFAKAMGDRARLIELSGPCGHLATTREKGCEGERITEAVKVFLAE